MTCYLTEEIRFILFTKLMTDGATNLGVIVLVLEMRRDELDRIERLLAIGGHVEGRGVVGPPLFCRLPRLTPPGGRDAGDPPGGGDVGAGGSAHLLRVGLLGPAVVVAGPGHEEQAGQVVEEYGSHSARQSCKTTIICVL